MAILHRFYCTLVFLSLKIILVLANSVDPDEMPHYVALHLGLHCLPKYKCMHLVVTSHAQLQKILSGGPTLTFVFLVDEGWEDPNTTISGPSSARRGNDI